jgi:hypothetical protein
MNELLALVLAQLALLVAERVVRIALRNVTNPFAS